MRASLRAAAADWPLVTADLIDAASLAQLAAAARVVVSTAGPYAPAGLGLVEACAAAGADYLDLCGEVLLMRESIDRCHAAAATSGAPVVTPAASTRFHPTWACCCCMRPRARTAPAGSNEQRSSSPRPRAG